MSEETPKRALVLDMQSRSRVYGLSLVAWRLGNPTTVAHQAWAVVASDDEDARSQGFTRAFELWPSANGWQGHGSEAIRLEIELAKQTDSVTKDERTDHDLVM